MPRSYWILQFVLLSTFFGVLLGMVCAPVVSALFRRRVRTSMNRASEGGTQVALDVPGAPPPHPRGASRAPIHVSARGAPVLHPSTSELIRTARSRVRRLALAYVGGGLGHALVMTTIFVFGLRSSGIRSRYEFLSFPIFALLIVPTATHVLGAPLGVNVLALCAVLGAILLASGPASMLVWSLAQLHLALPVAIVLLFNLRYLRCVVPLMWMLALGGISGWMTGLAVGRLLFEAHPLLQRLGCVLGFALGSACGWRMLRGIGRYYRAKRTSEQELFVDTWWAFQTVYQGSIFAVTSLGLMVGALAAFPIYWIAKRRLMHGLQDDQAPARRLLLLRVFGHDRRSERLLDRIGLLWRHFGTVTLIAGPDLAFRTIDPLDLYAFLSGGLTREFVKDGGDLERRLAGLDERRDPDGRYRLTKFFCHQNTWKQVLDELVGRCDAVLMDLRGFDEQRRGCRYEISRLATHLGTKPIVLLVDGDTRVDQVEALLRLPTEPGEGSGPAGCFLLEVGPARRAAVGIATQLLLGARPA